MMKSPARGQLIEKWSSISVSLGLENDVLSRLRIDNMQLRPTTEELYDNILTKWAGAKKENKATLGELVKALESKGLNDVARCIKDQFYGITSGETVPDSGKVPKLIRSSQQNPVQAPISVTPEELDFIKNVTPFEVVVTRPTSAIKRVNDHYKLPKNFKGYGLIINVIEFDSPENQRVGATNDTKYMNDLWTALGYKMIKHEGHFTVRDIENIMAAFVEEIEENEDEIKSCVAFIGSHGQHGSIVLSDDSEINVYEDFIYKLTSLEVLKGKPKIFIVQACQHFPRTRKDKKGQLEMPCEDTMICFSTIPGEGSNRDVYLGTWYINCLTRVFMKNAYHMDLEEMLDEVIKFI